MRRVALSSQLLLAVPPSHPPPGELASGEHGTVRARGDPGGRFFGDFHDAAGAAAAGSRDSLHYAPAEFRSLAIALREVTRSGVHQNGGETMAKKEKDRYGRE